MWIADIDFEIAPAITGNLKKTRIIWEEAYEIIAERLLGIREKYGALALSMDHVIIEERLYENAFMEKYVYGFEEYRRYAGEFPPERAQEIIGADAELIREAARLYAANGPAGIMFSASPVVHYM